MEIQESNTKDKNPFIAGNLYNKYNSKNPITQFLMNNFLRCLEDLLDNCSDIHNILEVGCGEGHLANYIRLLRKGIKIDALDISEEMVKLGHAQYPHIKFTTASVYQLPYEDNSKDLVVACELLEHLDDPVAALLEIKRVSRKYGLLSVPREPYWSFCNICRGKYLRYMGNTPPHVQKWTKKQFIPLIEKHLKIIQIRTPFPWIMVMCNK